MGTSVRRSVVESPNAFNSIKLQESLKGDAGKCAGQFANWVLIVLRYYDAIRSNMQMTLQNQGPEGMDGPAYAQASLPVRTAIPKALESWNLHKIPILYDAKGLAGTFLKLNKAKIIDASDPRHLHKGPLHKALCHAIEYDVPLVIDLCKMEDLKDPLPVSINSVQEGLYDELLGGKATAGPDLLRKLKGDNEISPKSVGSFGLYLLTAIQTVPGWIPEEGYVVIEV